MFDAKYLDGIARNYVLAIAEKKLGVSKGGKLNKKTRAAFEMTGASIADMEDGKGFGTDSARATVTKVTK